MSGAAISIINRIHANEEIGEIIGVDFSNINLGLANFAGQVFRSCLFNKCSLRGANFRTAVVRHCIFREADLTKANFSESHLESCVFIGANLTYTNLGHSARYSCTFDRDYFAIDMSPWEVIYTPKRLQIGCKAYRPEEWWAFSDEEIDKMSPTYSLKWWRIYKPILRLMVENANDTHKMRQPRTS